MRDYHLDVDGVFIPISKLPTKEIINCLWHGVEESDALFDEDNCSEEAFMERLRIELVIRRIKEC